MADRRTVKVASSRTAKLQNGTAALSRLVWWAIGIGATLFIGGAAFFATAYLQSFDQRLSANAMSVDSRNEKLRDVETRVTALETMATSSLQEIKGSLGKMETWQIQVIQDLADLKAAVKTRP